MEIKVKKPWGNKKEYQINFLQVREGIQGIETFINPQILMIDKSYRKQVLHFLVETCRQIEDSLKEKKGDK